jgi:hypothetical protein
MSFGTTRRLTQQGLEIIPAMAVENYNFTNATADQLWSDFPVSESSPNLGCSLWKKKLMAGCSFSEKEYQL